MISEGRSWQLRRRKSPRASGGAGFGEGFAPVRVVCIYALWALIHSVLASTQAQDPAGRIAGPRYRDGLYGITFNAQSVVSLV